VAGPTSGSRFTWIVKQLWRHGTQPWAQASDNTGLDGNLAAFNADGSVTDSGISGLNVGALSGAGSWYGQVPRGPNNGSNRVFFLDYNIANPYTVCVLGGAFLKPAVDGPGTNPDPAFTITGGNVLTYTVAPRPTSFLYIEYFRDVAAPIAPVASATLSVWTSFTGGSSPHAFANIAWNYPVSQGGSINIQSSANAFYALRETTVTLTLPGSPTIDSFDGGNITFDLLGSLLSSGDPNHFNIYDVFITLTLADSSTVVVRPTSWSIYSGGAGNQRSWAASTPYTSGTQIVDSNGNIQQATNTFSSAGTPPTWAFSGNTTETTGLIWNFIGAQSSTTGEISNPAFAYDADSNPPTSFAQWTQTQWGGLVSDGSFTVNF
jgi:hypothetical protein